MDSMKQDNNKEPKTRPKIGPEKNLRRKNFRAHQHDLLATSMPQDQRRFV